MKKTKEKRLTWNDVYEDFKRKHPRYAKTVIGFAPCNYATITLIFPKGVRRTYNYDTKELVQIK